LKTMMRSFWSATGFFVASKRLKGKLALRLVRRTRRRERALEKLTCSLEEKANRPPPQEFVIPEGANESDIISAEGWSDVSSLPGRIPDREIPAQPVSDRWWRKQPVTTGTTEPKVPDPSLSLAEQPAGRRTTEPKVPDPPNQQVELGPGSKTQGSMRNMNCLRKDHRRWLELASSQVNKSIPVSLNFKIKEREKRKIISSKRFSVKDRKVIPFGDSYVYPNRLALEAHNARANLYEQISGLAWDIAHFRLSPEVLVDLIGMAKELSAICHSRDAFGMECQKLLKRLGFLLRISGVRAGRRPTSPVPTRDAAKL